MKKYINGVYLDISADEVALMQSEAEHHKDEIPPMLSYDELVDMEIRKRYTASEEFAILRQKDEKPNEYAEYYAYCEKCKENVKNRTI